MKTLFKRLGIHLAAAVFALPTPAQAASKMVLDAKITEAVETFYEISRAGEILAEKAAGMLVFPKIAKAGLGVGGEYGEGALLVDGEVVDYYRSAAASVGLQFGAQVRTQIILFMEEEALQSFRNSSGWEVGVDGSVAIASLGAAGKIDSETAKQPVIGFIIANKGLMYNLTLEGTKISKLDKDKKRKGLGLRKKKD